VTSTILLLGEYDVGKSHFGAQLLGRLNREEGALRMVGTPSSLAPFDSVLSRLNDGRAAGHTSASSYTEARWPIANTHGRAIDLVWPEYGGEQVSEITSSRRMSPEWRKRVQNSDGWIIMVRINNSHLSDDVFTRPLIAPSDISTGSKPFRVSDQARLVDFLQWLMFVRGLNTLVPNAAPQLLLLLSCWDELPEGQLTEKPLTVLNQRMPLVSSFVCANWAANAMHVLGLSALERSLSEDAEDSDYVDFGPEHFGYVVKPDGTHDPDLTLAIAPLV
jgi:hypothetical protein